MSCPDLQTVISLSRARATVVIDDLTTAGHLSAIRAIGQRRCPVGSCDANPATSQARTAVFAINAFEQPRVRAECLTSATRPEPLPGRHDDFVTSAAPFAGRVPADAHAHAHTTQSPSALLLFGALPCQALSWAGDLTINGNGSTIGRSTNSGTPDFRIVRVSSDTVAFNGLSDRGDESGDVAIRDIGTTHAAMICKYDESLPHAVSLSQVRRRSKRRRLSAVRISAGYAHTCVLQRAADDHEPHRPARSGTVRRTWFVSRGGDESTPEPQY